MNELEGKKQKQEENVLPRWTQPQLDCQLVKVWLSNLAQMHTSELVQWRIAAMNIYDLKKQNKLRDKWMDDYQYMHGLEHNLQEH
jgi:hypothetical protein